LKSKSSFCDAFNEQEFVTTNLEWWNIKPEKEKSWSWQFLGNEDLEDVKALIEDLEIACPESGSRNWQK
jgi:glycyl-tRNA synthetase